MLGLLFMERLSIDLDEPFSIFHAQKNLHELSSLFVTENNPPLHFILLHYWVSWFGVSPFATRSLSLFFSVLTLIVLYRIGKIMSSDKMGLILMMFFTFSNFHHSYGIEARAYSLFTLLFAASIWLLLELYKNFNLKRSIAFSFICAGLFYTHYISILVLPFLFLVNFVIGYSKKSRKVWAAFVIGLLVFSIILLPIIPSFIARLNHVNDAGTWVEKPHWTALYGLLIKFLNGPFVVLGISLVVIYVLYHSKDKVNTALKEFSNSTLYTIVLITSGIYISAFLISLFSKSAVFIDRYLFFLSIGFFILLAYTIDMLFQKKKYLGWMPLAIFVISFNPFKTHNRNSDELVKFSKKSANSFILSPPHYDLTFVYHYDRNLFEKIPTKALLFENQIYPIYGLHEIKTLQHIATPIAYVDAGSKFLYGETKLFDELSSFYVQKETKIFEGGYRVVIFE